MPRSHLPIRLSRLGMALFYVLAGANHFRDPQFHLAVMPEVLPYRLALVYGSGLLAMALGLLVLIPRWRRTACWGLVVMLLLFLPIHVYMLVDPNVLPELPPWLRWSRFGLQFLLVAWALFHARRDLPFPRSAG